MITDTDPRVAEAIRLASHGDLATLGVYLTTLLAKVPSAPVEAVPRTLLEELRNGINNLATMSPMYDRKEYAIRLKQKITDWLDTTPPQAEASRADVDHLNGMVREAVRGLEERDAEIARLTAELADEKAVVDVLRSELQDRLQKQRAAEAELREAREEAALPMSETALEAAAKVMAEAFDYPWEHMPTVGRINMRTIAKNVIDAAMTKAKP